jgi:hypothetical protein
MLLYKIREDIPTIIVVRYISNNRNYTNPEDFKDIDLYKLFNDLENKLKLAELYLITTISINKALSNNLNLNTSNTSSNLGRFNNSEY